MAIYTKRISLTLDLIFEICGEYKIKETQFCELFGSNFPVKEYIQPHLDNCFVMFNEGRFVVSVEGKDGKYYVVSDNKNYKFDELKEVPEKIFKKCRELFPLYK